MIMGVCIWVSAWECWYSQRPEEGIRSADSGVTGGREPPDINAGKTGVAGAVHALNC